MFGLGLWEIVIILVAVIIFIRPRDLPTFLRNLGKMYRRITNLYKNMSETMKNFEAEIRKSADAADTANSDIEKEQLVLDSVDRLTKEETFSKTSNN
jgi:Sec-independent protein translocase protein TatA